MSSPVDIPVPLPQFKDLTPEMQRELVRRWRACRWITEKEALASDLQTSVGRLYNIKNDCVAAILDGALA